MSSTTSRVSLYKPAGGENVNVTTDLNNNLDKIDTNLSFRVAASATARNAISPFWAGLNVRDTDSGKLWVSNGSAPISGSWDQIVTANTYTTALNVAPAATGTTAINQRAGSDTQNRFQVRGDGQLSWGSGSATTDTNLYRSAADTLKTDDSFQAVGSLQSGGDLISTSGQLQLQNGGTIKKNAVPSSSTTVASTTSETVMATYTIPANDAAAGAVYRITAWGTISVTGTPTFFFRTRLGGVSGITLGTTTLADNQSSGVTGKPWKAEVYVVCLSTGGSGTWFGNLAVTNGGMVAGGVPVKNPTQYIDGASQVTRDTTASQDLVITANWGTSSSSNTITCRGFAAERVA